MNSSPTPTVVRHSAVQREYERGNALSMEGVALDQKNSEPILVVVGDCDLEQASALVELDVSALDSGAHALAVDLSEASYFSEYCLGALLSLRRVATQHGATMTLRNPSAAARRKAGLGALIEGRAFVSTRAVRWYTDRMELLQILVLVAVAVALILGAGRRRYFNRGRGTVTGRWNRRI
jgi:anti-anti-sigma regulatory factor